MSENLISYISDKKSLKIKIIKKTQKMLQIKASLPLFILFNSPDVQTYNDIDVLTCHCNNIAGFRKDSLWGNTGGWNNLIFPRDKLGKIVTSKWGPSFIFYCWKYRYRISVFFRYFDTEKNQNDINIRKSNIICTSNCYQKLKKVITGQYKL